jgi:hypothetical protein
MDDGAHRRPLTLQGTEPPAFRPPGYPPKTGWRRQDGPPARLQIVRLVAGHGALAGEQKFRRRP